MMKKNMDVKSNHQNIVHINYFHLFKIIQKFFVLIAQKKSQMQEKKFYKNLNLVMYQETLKNSDFLILIKV